MTMQYRGAFDQEQHPFSSKRVRHRDRPKKGYNAVDDGQSERPRVWKTSEKKLAEKEDDGVYQARHQRQR